METRRDVFQAIADPTRRAILTLLASQVLTPGAIAAHFDSTRQTISRHIKILVECELVKQENAGREIYYHFNAGKVKEITDWLDPIRRNWEKKFDRIDQLVKEIKSKNK